MAFPGHGFKQWDCNKQGGGSPILVNSYELATPPPEYFSLAGDPGHGFKPWGLQKLMGVFRSCKTFGFVSVLLGSGQGCTLEPGNLDGGFSRTNKAYIFLAMPHPDFQLPAASCVHPWPASSLERWYEAI